MNIKKSKMVLALGSLLFLSVPLSGAFADENNQEIQEMQQLDTMALIKSELRGYVKAVKADDSQMIQQHINKLLQLSEKATKEIPAKIYMAHSMDEMDHGNMDMSAMDHSQMDHSKMDMADMDHSQMDHSKMDMADMDHSQMDHSNMDMTGMDHSQMDHSNIDMTGMDHSQMNNADMNSADHDMSAMPSMAGMTAAQHHQHMIYMQGTEKLQASLQQLAKTQNKSEIKAILGEIKVIIKDNQLFR